MTLRRLQDFSSDTAEFAGDGLAGTAVAGQCTNIDMTLSEPLMIVGIEVMLDGNQAWDDYAQFQVLSGDIVLSTFCNKWHFREGLAQASVVLPIPAFLQAGLTIRIKYHSHGDTDVKAKFNLYLYRPK